MISAIILAAGESQRMGRMKQLLPWGRTTVLEQVIGNILESRVREVIVVLGYQAQKIVPKIVSKPIKIVINPDYRQGMSSSIKWGLTSVDKRSKAILIILGDQPLIDKGIIDQLIREFLKGRHSIVVPVCQGVRGHPVILDLKYKKEILNLVGDVGCREILAAYPQEVLEVEVDSPQIFADLDSLEDYQRQLKIYLNEGWQ